MTAFSPSSHPPPDLSERPHHNLPDLPAPPTTHPTNTFTQSFSQFSPSSAPRITHRSSADFRAHPHNGAMPGANGNAPMPVPGPHGRMGNGHGTGQRGMPFDGPRSPPNNKSTSHVPCKFYRQGACQAGKACPFLHSDEPLAERAPCKYFTKGNCKFGAKCALAHILPDGRVVNRPNFGGGGGHLNLGGRVNLPPHAAPAPGDSLLSMQAHMSPLPPPNYPYPGQDDIVGGQHGKSQYDTIPTIDTTFSSHPGSNYGSPPNETGRLPISPIQKGLSVMDAPLPASFDSQGISHMARYGPIAASVPSRFGLATSPPSSFQEKPVADSPALRNLHHSAFGDDSRAARNAALASSPPDSVEQAFGKRMMHSSIRPSKSRGMMSASLGARPPQAAIEDWEDENFTFEEDMVPSALHDLLTPQERMRRFSRDQGDIEPATLSHRNSLSRLGASPTDSSLKIGSPSAATSSPSRFQSLWGKPRPTEGGSEAGSLPGASAFGHVGSPLRNSSLHPGASPSMRAIPRPTSGDASPFVSSPPRQASMSMISQQLQRTRLSSRASEGPEEPGFPRSNPMHPGIGRVASGSSVGSATGGRLGMDRAVSSSSIGREKIDEEQGLFNMEEEDEMDGEKRKDGASSTSSTSNKRYSGLSWTSVGKQSPSLGPIGGLRAANSGLAKDAWGNAS